MRAADGSSFVLPILKSRTSNSPPSSTMRAKVLRRMSESIRWPWSSTISWTMRRRSYEPSSERQRDRAPAQPGSRVVIRTLAEPPSASAFLVPQRLEQRQRLTGERGDPFLLLVQPAQIVAVPDLGRMGKLERTHLRRRPGIRRRTCSAERGARVPAAEDPGQEVAGRERVLQDGIRFRGDVDHARAALDPVDVPVP